MKLQVGVKILLKNTKGKYLILHRSSKKYRNAKGFWDIPGGRIKVGTKLIDNLKREIKEETGLQLKDTPKLIAAQDILRVKGKHIVRLTYMGIAKGKVELDPNEHDDYRWLSKNEIKKLPDLDSYLKKLFRLRP